jgi:glycogen(starch) synthase
MFSWETAYSIRTGGLAQAVTGMARALAAKGHEVHLFTRMGNGQGEYDQIDGVNYHRCAFYPGWNLLEYAWNCCQAMLARFYKVEKSVGKFDIIHGHDWHVVDVLNELKNKGYRVILSYHSTEYGRAGNKMGDWWEFKKVSEKEWYGGYIADRVTTVSGVLKDELRWLYQMPDWKIDVVPNGIYPEKYFKKADPGRVKEKYGINPLDPTILYIGRLDPQKGPDLLVEAIPHILWHRSDAKFIIIGEGGLRPHLEWRARDLHVFHAVRFFGYVPFEIYVEALNASDIVCIPSRNEPFGIVLLEAWAAGKAVVATDVGGLRENIENFVDGIKVFTYPESIAWGINYIIDDPHRVQLLGANGKKKAEEKFSWQAAAEKLLSTYQISMK